MAIYDTYQPFPFTCHIHTVMLLNSVAYLSIIHMDLEADRAFLDAKLAANHVYDKIRSQELSVRVKRHLKTLHYVAEAHPE